MRTIMFLWLHDESVSEQFAKLKDNTRIAVLNVLNEANEYQSGQVTLAVAFIPYLAFKC